MKVHAQLCNVPTPNSPKNTSVFTAFEAPDTTANLHIALARYQEQVVATCAHIEVHAHICVGMCVLHSHVHTVVHSCHV